MTEPKDKHEQIDDMMEPKDKQEQFKDKGAALAHLSENYEKIGHPIAFSGKSALKNYYQVLSNKEIEDFLSSSYTYNVHRETKRPKYNPTFVYELRYQLQFDTIEISKISKYNDNFKYILAAIDIFSRRGFARLLRTKSADETLAAIKSILQEAGKFPKTILSDKGSELRNSKVQDFYRKNEIKQIYNENSIHAPFVERLVYSLFLFSLVFLRLFR